MSLINITNSFINTNPIISNNIGASVSAPANSYYTYVAYGTAGNDTIIGSAAGDKIIAGAGDDIIN